MGLESLDLCRDIEEPKGAAYAMCTLALIALEQENYADAEARAREGVAIARAMGDRLLLTVNLHFWELPSRPAAIGQEPTTFSTKLSQLRATSTILRASAKY